MDQSVIVGKMILIGQKCGVAHRYFDFRNLLYINLPRLAANFRALRSGRWKR
jgi:hypothetical protein